MLVINKHEEMYVDLILYIFYTYQSGGDLENEEKLADKLMTMVRTAVKVQTAGDKPANFKRLTGRYSSPDMGSNTKVFVFESI